MAPVKQSRRAVALAAGAIAVAVAVAAVVVAAPALRSSDRGPTSAVRLKPDDATVTALGSKVYFAQCAACHGARLEGQPNWRQRGADGRLPAPPHDASGHTWHHPDEVLFRITKFGVAKAANLKDYVSAMPAYEGTLSDEEIVAVLSWIKSRWPSDIRAAHDELNRAAVR
jgi:S-disulfanyl-L-cysteine oxidoreductase SoxD